MLSTNIPTKIPIPFANSAGSSYKNTIPQASQVGITNGKASLTDGFPPLTFQPISSGGVPPFGADFNGILYEITAIQQWQEAGGHFTYDSSFSTTIGGYPKGAILQSANLAGLWVSTADSNTTNPDTGGAGWTSFAFEGSQAISITTADVTLTQLQSAYPILIVSGAITAARNLIFPAVVGEWIVQNNTTGAFNLTAKTASGTGVTLTQGQSTYIYGDGTNIYFADSAKVASFNGRVGAVSLTAGDVTAALGYTPGDIIYTGSYANVYQYTNQTATLPASQIGMVIVSGGGGNNLTLPLATSVPSGAVYAIFGQGGVCNVYSQGSEHIGVGPNNTGTQVILTGSEYATFVADSGNWVVSNGTPMLPASGMFASSLTSNGYQKLPGGLILQWGSHYSNGTTGAVYQSYNFAFPNNCLNVSVTGFSESVVATDIFGINTGGYNQYNFLVWGSTNADGPAIMRFTWMAIGY